MSATEGVEHECDKHGEEDVIDQSGLDKELSFSNTKSVDAMEGNEHSDTSASDSSDMDSSTQHADDDDRAFFVKTHIDGKDDDENNEFMDNEDVESVSEKSDLNAVENVDEISDPTASEMEKYEVLSLLAIASNFFEKCYAGDIDKVKAEYAQLIAFYRAQSAYIIAGIQSEISEEAPLGSKLSEVVNENKHDVSKSDTSGEITQSQSDEDVKDVVVDDIDVTDGEGLDGKVIGTLSEIPENEIAEISVNSAESQSNTKDTESECKMSQPDSTPNSEILLHTLQESICDTESSALVIKKRTQRDIEMSIAVKDIKKEPVSAIFVTDGSDEDIISDEGKAHHNVSLRNFIVKSPEMIDITQDDSNEDYGEKSMEEPTGSQIHGDNGKYIFYFMFRMICIYYCKAYIMANKFYKLIIVIIVYFQNINALCKVLA